MNQHQFEQAAKKFRAGRMTLEQFSEFVFAANKSGNEPSHHSPEPDAIPASLPARPGDAHKGDFGRILVVGGSLGMAGAVSLASLAALRCGSGLVLAAVPEAIQLNVSMFSPCYMTLGLPDSKGRLGKESVDKLLEVCEWADVVAVGPGLGRSKSLQKILRFLYSQLPQPLIVDADGINNLADGETDLSHHEGSRVLTPHPGEFQRLDGQRDTSNRAELERRAVEMAAKASVTIVLKGHRTLVTDGKESFHNPTGNPGMATGGSGDVLTGVIASWVGQGFSPLEAARSGVYFHGMAGDLGAVQMGQASLIASDLLNFLPQALNPAQPDSPPRNNH